MKLKDVMLPPNHDWVQTKNTKTHVKLTCECGAVFEWKKGNVKYKRNKKGGDECTF